MIVKHEKITLVDPGQDYRVIKEVEATKLEEIDQKVQLARKVLGSWAQISLQDRVQILQKLLLEFQNRKQDIARAIAQEMGMPISVCLSIDIALGLSYMQGYLENAATWLAPETVYENSEEKHQIYFEPYGVVGVSIPWNYPFCNFIWAVIQNLVVGNTVVIKHSE